MLTATMIADAWHGTTVEYGTRKNKMRTDGKFYEVYRFEGDVISDETLTVVAAFSTQEKASITAKRRDDQERAAAVLALVEACFIC